MVTPVCTIDATGLHLPTYADCLAYVTAQYQGIYGQDVYLGADCQDGQFVGILALALSDANAMAAAAYNSRGPATAQGAGLSSIVKINGISRKVPTLSTADVLIGGQAGAIISNGVVSDGTNAWVLPAFVTIPLAGQILVTATAALAGAVKAAAGTINQITTPTLGWQSVTNPNDATIGAPIETDAALRVRQSQSTMIPALSVFDGLVGAVAAVAGVQTVTPYENAGDAPDANGIPGHCVSLVVTGGADADIAAVIARKKGPGVNTYGASVVTVTDRFGIARDIAFFRQTTVPVSYTVVLRPLHGYTQNVRDALVSALVTWTNALGCGRNVLLSRASVPANLYGAAASAAYEILSLMVARDGRVPDFIDVPIGFFEIATCDPSFIQVQVAS